MIGSSGRRTEVPLEPSYLCCWGALEEIVSNNGLAFIEALNCLAEQYGIHHICISPFNSQANRIVECHHLDVWERYETERRENGKLLLMLSSGLSRSLLRSTST
jgi:hypothetical protein